MWCVNAGPNARLRFGSNGIVDVVAAVIEAGEAGVSFATAVNLLARLCYEPVVRGRIKVRASVSTNHSKHEADDGLMFQAGPALGALLSLVSTLAEDIDANRGHNVAVRTILIGAGCFRTIHIMAPLRPRRPQGPCSRNACWRWGTSNLTRSVAVPGNEGHCGQDWTNAQPKQRR
jgi:hypothetical protein